ncbi:MAG TPA: DNA polymerase III subunit gamma/tau, partial [Desulfobacteraceae bacterium]|nr:DNA polymerase III subunit gamma/tau [Desulfobacteraceae bacterium]
MSYLVLARKSRPRTFDEVIGQQAVVRTLQNALSQNRVPHALIFSGVRGVGKTTLARIMAKALNCEQGPTATPCNQCRSCREIMSGVSVDLHEVDGASNRGIQEIREMKEQIRFMPTGSRFKIIIIDEVHMLTSEAFNALLKTIEEPPEHVYFMFATTEMHRVPVTILSRCQRYELKRVGSRDLTAHFSAIAASEKVEIEPAALNLIVREARGSVRDGLSLLDQIFSYCGDAVSADEVVDVLGLVSHRIIAGLASSLLAGDLAAALGQLDQVYTYGMDLKRFINDLLAWFRDLVVCRVSSKPEQLLDLAEEEMAALRETAAAHSVETLSFMFNVLMESLEKASFSSRPRFALELAFIRAVQVREVVPVTDILARLDAVAAGVPPEPEGA